MAKLLTVRKQRWVSRFKPDVLRGEPIAPNMSVATRYREKMDSMIRRMVEETHAELERLFRGEPAQEFFAEDASVASQARKVTNALIKKYDRLFGGNAKWIAEAFANQADVATSKAVHASIRKLSGGLSLGTRTLEGPLEDVVKASIAENVALIKSIPQKYLNGVQQAVMRSITTGNGMQELVSYLEKHKSITYARAKMIAHDQTRKITQNMAKERMERLGIKEFEWRHVASNHPRREHIDMNGKVYSLNDPPVIDSKTGERGYPGQLINCRCIMQPVISFEENDDAA